MLYRIAINKNLTGWLSYNQCLIQLSSMETRLLPAAVTDTTIAINLTLIIIIVNNEKCMSNIENYRHYSTTSKKLVHKDLNL